MDLDQVTAVRREHHKIVPHQFFMREMYCQPTLGRTAPVLPAPYRRYAPKNTGLSGGAGGVPGSGGSNDPSRGVSTATVSTVWDIEQGKHSVSDPTTAAAANPNPNGSNSSGKSGAAVRRTVGGSSRQSLGARGMYAYDDASDEEDIRELEATLEQVIVIQEPGAAPPPAITSPHSAPFATQEVRAYMHLYIYVCTVYYVEGWAQGGVLRVHQPTLVPPP